MSILKTLTDSELIKVAEAQSDLTALEKALLAALIKNTKENVVKFSDRYKIRGV